MSKKKEELTTENVSEFRRRQRMGKFEENIKNSTTMKTEIDGKEKSFNFSTGKFE